MSLRETQKAYIAAALDGEGSISFKLRRDSKEPWAYDIRVKITNTNKRWLFGLKRELGGSLARNGKLIPKRKQGWTLQIDGVQCRKVLALVLPYLRIKAKQARLALSYRPCKPGYNHHLSEAVKKKRIRNYLVMKALNKRGR